MTTQVEILADSENPYGERITTFYIKCPRIIWAEMLTHRALSRNAQSSRAMRVETMIEEIKNDPFIPKEWRYAKKGMQAGELMGYAEAAEAESHWRSSLQAALSCAERLLKLGAAKEHVNRLLEPFSYIRSIVTATDFDNFYDLRISDKAQSEIHEVALMMQKAQYHSVPTELAWGEWHLPFFRKPKHDYDHNLALLSAAQMARVSYGKPDSIDIQADLKLADRLLDECHMSPFEHQAIAMKGKHANFSGFCGYRSELEQ